MRFAYRAETVRAAEEPLLAADPGGLMQRAAAGLAGVLLWELRSRRGAVYGARVMLAVGAGNNGGDALFAGARLAARGVRVGAWRTGGRVHEPAWAAFLRAGGYEVDAVHVIDALPSTDLVVDGVLGIGGRPGLPAPVALLARACRDLAVPVVAVDLPSGLDADGCVATEDAFVADVTVTFGGLKPCLVLEPAASKCGRVECVEIGLRFDEPDLRCWDPADVATAWPVPNATSDKYERGVVALQTGSPSYPGAAVLGVLGAVHAGAGMVRFTGAAEAVALIQAAAPSVVVGAGRVQARVLGSGWGAGDRDSVAAAVAEGMPLVLDADALRDLPDGLGERALLTPHAGELARLLGTERSAVTADPWGSVRSAAGRWGATVLLKGATQYVATSDGRVAIAVPGPAWTAQAGSGDVLAGICGTLLAAGLRPAEAALAAASLQAMTARDHPGPVPPDELARRLPHTLGALLAGR